MKKNLVAILACGTLASCSAYLESKDNIITPYGLFIEANGYHPDPERADAKYLATCDCLELDPQKYKNEFTINIKTDGRSFHCVGYDYDNEEYFEGECSGQADYSTNNVNTTESLRTVSHELTHLIGNVESHSDDRMIYCGEGIDDWFWELDNLKKDSEDF